MRAVILAAGRGGRLRDVTGNRPKCLARIGERTLIDRQIRALRRCGIDTITVVAGFRAADVRRSCGAGIDFVVNARYASTNSLYSLWLARDLLLDGFVVLNCDVLFHDQLLRDLLSSRDEDALLMAAPRGQSYGDEEMKISVRRGCVAEIAKTLEPDAADGENVGIAKFGADGARRLIAAMGELIDAEQRFAWAPRAFKRFAQDQPLHAVGTRGLPWTEIDTPDDYRHGVEHVYPAIRDALDRQTRVEVRA